MGAHTARIPENLEEYIDLLIGKGYAANYGSAINLIILERMMRDKQKGEISPFEFKLRDSRRSAEKSLEEIGTDNIEKESRTLPLREAPPIAGPSPAERIVPKTEPKKTEGTASDDYGLPKSKKPVYPGPLSAYREDLRRGVIREGMFEPPEE